jgi:hypothetical protein
VALGGIQLELDHLQASDRCFVSSWGYYRIAAGKRRGERGGRREKPPSAQELYASEPIGSNVHFSFSPFAIGGTVWDPHSEQCANGVMIPEKTHLSRRCGASAPHPISGRLWRKHVRRERVCGNADGRKKGESEFHISRPQSIHDRTHTIGGFHLSLRGRGTKRVCDGNNAPPGNNKKPRRDMKSPFFTLPCKRSFEQQS